MNPLYENIKIFRIQLGLSQDELARKMGYTSRSTIAKIEAGINDIPQSKIEAFAKALNTTPGILMGYTDSTISDTLKSKGVKIPVLGLVRAGIPMDAVEHIIDYEEISEEMASCGDFFGLQIKGDSMEPKISEGDVVIVRKQPDINNGDIAIVLVNGDEATIKKVQKFNGGINLIPSNPNYDVMTFTNDQIEQLPVQILGKVVELRAKF